MFKTVEFYIFVRTYLSLKSNEIIGDDDAFNEHNFKA